MARAFALATVAGRLGRLAGVGAEAAGVRAQASSPLTGFVGGDSPTGAAAP
jgi:thiazole synthase